MNTTRSHDQVVGDERLEAATGRGRGAWYALLDEAGAVRWGHAAIARWLVEEHGVDGWWAQGITVSYEQARGLRQPGQRPDGTFDANASKTLHASPSQVWPHLAEDAQRSAWLAADWELMGATEPKSVRLRADGDSRVVLMLTEATRGRDGRAKVRVSVQHSRLVDAEAAARTKAFWQGCLSLLADRVGNR